MTQEKIAVEDLVITFKLQGSSQEKTIEAYSMVELDEFNLTDIELEKFSKIFEKLNKKLYHSLQENSSSVSIESKIVSKQDAYLDNW